MWVRNFTVFLILSYCGWGAEAKSFSWDCERIHGAQDSASHYFSAIVMSYLADPGPKHVITAAIALQAQACRLASSESTWTACLQGTGCVKSVYELPQIDSSLNWQCQGPGVTVKIRSRQIPGESPTLTWEVSGKVNGVFMGYRQSSPDPISRFASDLGSQIWIEGDRGLLEIEDPRNSKSYKLKLACSQGRARRSDDE